MLSSGNWIKYFETSKGIEGIKKWDLTFIQPCWWRLECSGIWRLRYWYIYLPIFQSRRASVQTGQYFWGYLDTKYSCSKLIWHFCNYVLQNGHNALSPKCFLGWNGR